MLAAVKPKISEAHQTGKVQGIATGRKGRQDGIPQRLRGPCDLHGEVMVGVGLLFVHIHMCSCE